jgi:hypothetical protein
LVLCLNLTVCANTVCDAPAVIIPTRANVARMRAVVGVLLFVVIWVIILYLYP